MSNTHTFLPFIGFPHFHVCSAQLKVVNIKKQQQPIFASLEQAPPPAGVFSVY